MDLASVSTPTVNARRLLLPYALTLIVAVVIIQTVIAVSGGQITLLATVLTFALAIGIAVWVWRNYRAVTRVRFGLAIAHTVAFITVTTSFNMHAVIHALAVGGQPDSFEIVAYDLFATPWFGATLVMSSVWGIGLLVHLIGTILGRGWED